MKSNLIQDQNWPSIKPIKKEKPYGTTSPYAWAIELVHGCNLRCGHCSCRLLPQGKFQFMKKSVWKKLWSILNEVSPTVRIDLALAGEPTLHPNIVEFLQIARKLAPRSQIQITTNGTMLLKGVVNYKELLNAGANIIYTDMYGPKEKFIKLATKSKFPFYEYYAKPDNAPSSWTFYGPHFKLIVLQEQPENWPKSRFRAGLLGTWYNHLDWEAAAKFGLKPVVKPLTRRCNQPFVYVPVHVSGKYLLCCQDNWGETAGKFGSVLEGVGGFKRYWYGKELQIIRRRLRDKNRAATSYCSRCCITFSRCDYKHWTDEEVSRWWTGKLWRALPKQDVTDHPRAIPDKVISKGFNLI